VQAKWEEALKHETPELLIEYLNYRQTSFGSFTYPDVVATYIRILNSLRRLAWTTTNKTDIEKAILYVLERFTHFAREAGYDELATATFQGLIELNFFRPPTQPPTSSKSHDLELDAFEEFWDSECPRFGEEGAQGWRNFNPDAPVPDVPLAVPMVSDDWFEREEQSRGAMPARTTDEVEDDDPYRVILFSDIRPFLYTFSTDVGLSYRFLAFCGVSVATPGMSSSDPWMTDSWVHNVFNGDGFWPRTAHVEAIEWIDGEAVEPERIPGINGPFGFKRKIFPTSLDTLFPHQWFGLDESDFRHVNTAFLSTALQQLKPVIQDEWFMVYHLAIENILSPDTVAKLAKSYIKARKTSTLLWNVYALLLWRKGNHEEARRVWKTAIEMTSSTKTNPSPLWRTWIEAEFEIDATNTRKLISLVPGGNTNGTGEVCGAGEMKTRKFLQDQFDRALSFKEWSSVESYATISILLEYISINLDAAMHKANEIIQAVKPRDTPTHEQILLSISKLLYHHTQVQGWYRSSTLRIFWLDAISSFPQNTAFQSLFAWNEASSRIDNRVRKLFSSLEREASVDTWLMEIWAEVGIANSVSEYPVRAIFERAVESKRYLLG
jgi:NRDE-2, necessary for RNA interference